MTTRSPVGTSVCRILSARRGTVSFEAIIEVFNVLNRDNFRDPSSASLLFNFDGTIRNGLGDPRLQLGTVIAI